MRMPGCAGEAPGTEEQCGSNMTRLSPLTSCGRSVTWYAALKPSPNLPVVARRSSLLAWPMRARFWKSRSAKLASL